MSLAHLATRYGYPAVCVGVAVESMGVPVPGETILIAAGAYAGTTHRLSGWIVFAVAAGAAIVGDNIGYWAGRRGGFPLLRRYGHRIGVDDSKLKVGRYVFDRHGPVVVLVGRFVSVLRTYAAFLAGTNRMRWRVFLVANAAGGVAWAGLYAFGAYYAGDAIQRASLPISLGLGAVVLTAIAAALVVSRRQAGRLTARAEAAYPGPVGER